MRRLMGFFRNILRMAKDAAPDDQTQRQANESSGSDTSTSLGPGEFDPDHPISPGYIEDRLGFRSVANVLASSLSTHCTIHGCGTLAERLRDAAMMLSDTASTYS